MTYPHLLRCPRVKIDRFDLADVGAHSTMNTRAANTQKDTTNALMKHRKNKNIGQRTCSKRPNEDLRAEGSEWEERVKRSTYHYACSPHRLYSPGVSRAL
jgi:hypothetical protein